MSTAKHVCTRCQFSSGREFVAAAHGPCSHDSEGQTEQQMSLADSEIVRVTRTDREKTDGEKFQLPDRRNSENVTGPKVDFGVRGTSRLPRADE